MSVNISHLVVIGCSFAYGDGLEDPTTQSWPALLAKKIGVPIVNLSSKGGGNDKIQRRLFEYYHLDLNKNNNPFYFISYSHSSRREEYLSATNDYAVIGLNREILNKEKQDYEFSKAVLSNYDQEIYTRRKLMIQNYIFHFLQSNNLNYLTTDQIPDLTVDLEIVKEKFPIAYETVYSDPNRLINFDIISRKYKPLPCGHDDVEAQQEMAEISYNELIARYSSVNVVDDPYTTLQEYVDHYGKIGMHGGEREWL